VQSRRFPRYAINRPLQATLYWEDQPIRKLHGRALMVGEGGLGAWLTDQLYLGEVVQLEMPPMPALYATVRNTRGMKHGFEFLYSREGQRRAVSDLCATVAEEQKELPPDSSEPA
jgi:hypothetical protein